MWKKTKNGFGKPDSSFMTKGCDNQGSAVCGQRFPLLWKVSSSAEDDLLLPRGKSKQKRSTHVSNTSLRSVAFDTGRVAPFLSLNRTTEENLMFFSLINQNSLPYGRIKLTVILSEGKSRSLSTAALGLFQN